MNDIAVMTPTIPSRQGFLARCIKDISNQTLRPYAHLVRMNYSGVNSAVNGEAQVKCALQDPKINWFVLCSDDDWYYPSHVESLNAVKEDADIVYSWYRKIHADGRQNDVCNPHDPRVLFSETNYITNPMIHRRVFEKYGFPSRTHLDADWLFYKALSMLGCRFKCTERITFDYIDHGENVHLKGNDYYE